MPSMNEYVHRSTQMRVSVKLRVTSVITHAFIYIYIK